MVLLKVVKEMAFPVVLFGNDGRKNPQTAKFFMVREGELADIVRAMHARLYSDPRASGRGAASAADPARGTLYSLDGVVVDDAAFLQQNMSYVLVPDGEKLKLEPDAPPAAPPIDFAATGPRVVTCSFYVNNVKKVDAIEGVVELDFQLYLSWDDPALAGVPVAERPPYNEALRAGNDERPCAWNPEVEVNNNVSLESLWEVFPEQYQSAENGTVVWGARYRGGVANDMDLCMFPLDSDHFCVKIGPKSCTIDQVRLRIDPKKHGAPDDDLPGDSIKSSSLTEWALDVPSARLGKSGPTGSGAYYSNAEFGVMLHRNFMYYVWKVYVILFFLVVSSWSVFAQPPADFADRVSTALTLFLAAVAFLYVVGESLPKISYLTLLDKCMLIAFAFVFLSGAESFVVFVLDKRGSTEAAGAIDYWMSVLLPALYLALNVALTFKGFRYRWLIMNDKDSAAYRANVALESSMKDAEEAGGGGDGGAKDDDAAAAAVGVAASAAGRSERSSTSTLNPLYIEGAEEGGADRRGSGLLGAIARKRSSIVDKLHGISDAQARRQSRAAAQHHQEGRE